MEFPDLGKHCSDPACKQLDYLPLKCDACESIFCREHISYKNHDCPSAYKKDVQVPVCPLCNTPVPGKRGEQPDIAVSAHIDSDCMSDPAKNRRKVFTNKCSAKNCRVKEVMPVLCGECKLNFCLKHRHPADHLCEGAAGAVRRRAIEAAMARQAKLQAVSASSNSRIPRPVQGKPTQPQNATAGIQGELTEDEALARALALSLQDSYSNQPNGTIGTDRQQQINEDHLLARAIAESERRQRSIASVSSRDRCNVS